MLDALTEALVVRQLQPWFASISKRQVRSPKVYVRDSGLLHRLLGLDTSHDLAGHPKVGASGEGFVIELLLMLDVRTRGSGPRTAAPRSTCWSTSTVDGSASR